MNTVLSNQYLLFTQELIGSKKLVLQNIKISLKINSFFQQCGHLNIGFLLTSVQVWSMNPCHLDINRKFCRFAYFTCRSTYYILEIRWLAALGRLSPSHSFLLLLMLSPSILIGSSRIPFDISLSCFSFTSYCLVFFLLFFVFFTQSSVSLS